MMIDVRKCDALQCGRDIAKQSLLFLFLISLYLLSFVIIVFLYIGRIYFLAVCVDANLWLMFFC